jgi:hypothetical protein
MDALPLITALGGAFIGAVGSISGILIQSRNQARREMRTLAVQFARDDFHARVQEHSGKLDALPASVLIFYYGGLIDLVANGQLSRENIRRLLREQVELYESIQKEVKSWRTTRKSGRENDD